jgi:hypothetical protein
MLTRYTAPRTFLRSVTGMLGIVVAIALSGVGNATVKAEFPEERLDFVFSEKADGTVRFDISTAIPTPFEAIVEVALAGQQPRDVFIGHAERVFIDSPESEIIIDLVRSRMALPAGSYQARVAFYNAWGWHNGNFRAQDIPDTEVRKSVLLRGAGIAPSDARSRAEKQRWVFLNIKPTTRWVPQFFTRNIGDYDRLETGDIETFYFPEAQVTFLVGRESGRIVGWRVGKNTAGPHGGKS